MRTTKITQKEFLNGVEIIKDRLMISHTCPFRLVHFCENNASYLLGIEAWLSQRVNFTVNLFTNEQKKYFKCKHKEKAYRMGNKLIVGPRTFEQLSESLDK